MWWAYFGSGPIGYGIVRLFCCECGSKWGVCRFGLGVSVARMFSVLCVVIGFDFKDEFSDSVKFGGEGR